MTDTSELIFDKKTIKRLTKRSLWLRFRLLFVRRKNIVTGVDLVDGVAGCVTVSKKYKGKLYIMKFTDMHRKGWFHDARTCKVCKERQWFKQDLEFNKELKQGVALPRRRDE